jgi:hypothetical protein
LGLEKEVTAATILRQHSSNKNHQNNKFTSKLTNREICEEDRGAKVS